MDMDHHEKWQVPVFFKPPFDYLEETIRGVFKQHPEPQKIFIIGPKNNCVDWHAHRGLGRDARWKTNYAGYVQPSTPLNEP